MSHEVKLQILQNKWIPRKPSEVTLETAVLETKVGTNNRESEASDPLTPNREKSCRIINTKELRKPLIKRIKPLVMFTKPTVSLFVVEAEHGHRRSYCAFLQTVISTCIYIFTPCLCQRGREHPLLVLSLSSAGLII